MNKGKIVLTFLASLLIITTSAYAKDLKEEEKKVSNIETKHDMEKQDNIDHFLKDFYSSDKKIDKSKLFSEAFLKAIPYEQIEVLNKTLFAKVGKYEGYTKAKDGKIQVNFEHATVESIVKLNENNQIITLWFNSPQFKKIDINETLYELKSLDGIVSYNIRKNGKELFSYNENKPLAIGSAFKLYILKTLVEKINKKQETWDKVVLLDKKNFSAPSGFLHTWADKSPVTIATLANLMISQSDNTATDFLIEYLGRENIEKNAPKNYLPLLKTNEMFKLKWAIPKEQTEAYIKKDEKDKRLFLTELKNISLEKMKMDDKPSYIDSIEWFFTTKELCQVIEELTGQEAISINDSGLINKKWSSVGFKGGSEMGVLNLTYVFTKNSDYYSMSITVNDTKKDVEKTSLFPLVTKISDYIYDNL